MGAHLVTQLEALRESNSLWESDVNGAVDTDLR
jgi:hypothetical protein